MYQVIYTAYIQYIHVHDNSLEVHIEALTTKHVLYTIGILNNALADVKEKLIVGVKMTYDFIPIIKLCSAMMYPIVHGSLYKYKKIDELQCTN